MKLKALTIALAAVTALPAMAESSFSFTGYARYGAHYQNDDVARVNVGDGLNGNSAGRLGNEGNGGEWQFNYHTEGENGSQWNIGMMLEHWGDEVGLKKAFAGGKNLFASQPDLYVWGGRRFHQRPQTDLNDYFWMSHDGQGGGFENLDLGGAKLDLGFVGQADGSTPHDSGHYAITSKLHGFDLGFGSLDFYANYGFTSEAQDDFEPSSAYQVAANLKFSGHSLVVRYSDNTKDSVLYFWEKVEDRTAFLVHLEGGFGLSDTINLNYSTGYQTLEGKNDNDRANYHFIVRPTFQYSDVHSTWVEAGYTVVDYDDMSATNTAWKLTLSQNMAIGPKSWSRPMVRFYATVGNTDNEYTPDGPSDLDTVSFGAMFESWW